MHNLLQEYKKDEHQDKIDELQRRCIQVMKIIEALVLLCKWKILRNLSSEESR